MQKSRRVSNTVIYSYKSSDMSLLFVNLFRIGVCMYGHFIARYCVIMFNDVSDECLKAGKLPESHQVLPLQKSGKGGKLLVKISLCKPNSI